MTETTTLATGPYTYSYVDSESQSDDGFLMHTISSSQQDPILVTDNDYSKVKQRGTWANKIDFILSTTGYCIGYGNVWRFPYLAYTHGGGTFLIPYFIMLFLVGIPLFFLEIALGQYSGIGPTYIFQRMAPIVSGLGYGMCTIVFLGDVTYTFLLSWSLYYLFAGLVAGELPWAHCGDNRPFCIDDRNQSKNVTELDCHPGCVYATEDFYHNTVLGRKLWKSSWCDYGEINWTMVFCLLLAWTLVGSAIIQGIRSSTKVVYFTVPFPVVVLLILGCECLTLDGAGVGISYYVTPNATKLGEPSVWVDAATQIFFSLSIGYGTLHTLSSYNEFNNNCFHDAMIITFSDTLVSVISGFVIFGIIGFMAKTTGKEIEEVVKNGPDLAFITLPDAVSKMPFPRFWSFISFSMLVTLGLDTLFADCENIITSILDHNNWLRPYRSWVVMAFSTIGFLSGVSLCAPQGYEMFNLFDSHAANWNMMMLVFLEVVSVSWIYGAYNFWENIEEMGMKYGDHVKYYFLLCWIGISPMILFFLLTWHAFCEFLPDHRFCNSEPSKELPGIQALGYLIEATPLVILPLFAIKELLKYQRKGTIADLTLVFYPTLKWGPCKDKSCPKKETNLSFISNQNMWPPRNKLSRHWDPVEVRRLTEEGRKRVTDPLEQGTFGLTYETENTAYENTAHENTAYENTTYEKTAYENTAHENTAHDTTYENTITASLK